jgi:hypothetical protein
MKKIILSLFILFICKTSYSLEKMAVPKNNLNLRAEKSVESNILEVIKISDTVHVIEVDNQWTKVKFKDISGYLATDFLTIIDNTKIPTQPKTFSEQKGFVNGFIFVFRNTFIIVFFAIGVFVLWKSRKKDGRFKKGYREGTLTQGQMLKFALIALLIAIVFGFFGGIICLFH